MISSTLLFLLFGITVIDADLAMQKKLEVKALLELANHNATFAVDPVLKTEGIIELIEEEALDRFALRMKENGGYRQEGGFFVPSPDSVTTDPVAFTAKYVDFGHWQRDLRLSLKYTGDSLRIEQAAWGEEIHPSGGHITFHLTDEKGKELTIAPKKMIGPSLIAVAYVHDGPFSPLLPDHAFPVVSIEEVKH
ncbi:hypothetical protein [Brevibacillus massiliensis]|uniref:hypothetical protein n=1 Tax=Brevibacillus massiliensis TaxID=1118054 RepID=UPI0003621684|nr:hypothetical protein [Brevibacillus massiliensis]